MKKRRRPLRWILCIGLVLCAAILLWQLTADRVYDSAHFGIPVYQSAVDADGDGIDDQTDILESVKAYLATAPKYKSAYYANGWPDDGYGVCTDVVAQGLLRAGYDLRQLVQQDRLLHPGDYAQDETPDPNIDFRRVRNLLPYFRNNAVSLTTDPEDIAQWQPGDIVVWSGHIGVISEHRNARGIPLVYHHANARQTSYEEDVLARYGTVIGHFRIS